MYLLFIHIISFFNNFFQEPSLIISSLPEVFCKKVFLKKKKQLKTVVLESVFNKVAGIKASNLS